MKYFLMAIFLSACATTTISPIKVVNKEVIDSCKSYCRSSNCEVIERNKFTYFCECDNGRRIIVGSLGTLYRGE